MLNDKQLHQMLTMQDELNSRINPAWRGMSHNYHRAILVECAEALGYTSWPWWKQQKFNLQQIQLEIVDIWHFVISEYLWQYGSVEDTLPVIRDELKEADDVEGLISETGVEMTFADLTLADDIHFMAGLAGTYQIDLALFNDMLKKAKLTWDEVYKLYIGKNVLNTFRQKHGLKEGKYVKHWDGFNEDNVFLSDILDDLDIESDNLVYDIYRELELTYAAHISTERV